MSKFPAHSARNHFALGKLLTATVAAAFCAGVAAWAAPAAAQASASEKVPDLASISFAWLAAGVHWFDPPAGWGRLCRGEWPGARGCVDLVAEHPPQHRLRRLTHAHVRTGPARRSGLVASWAGSTPAPEHAHHAGRPARQLAELAASPGPPGRRADSATRHCLASTAAG